jgi:hypothetical protein
MTKEKIYNGFIWVIFIPLQLILSGIILLLIKMIPIIWIVNKIFDIDDANPLNTKIVNGPFGFLLVYLLFSLVLIISSIIAMGITSNPKLAWKILWTVQFFPLFIIILVYQITGKSFFSGNIWFNIAESSSIITAAVITYFFINDKK